MFLVLYTKIESMGFCPCENVGMAVLDFDTKEKFEEEMKKANAKICYDKSYTDTANGANFKPIKPTKIEKVSNEIKCDFWVTAGTY